MTILDRILMDVRDELAGAKAARPEREIRSMLADAPPPADLASALRKDGFGLIAEIKKKSPSVGPMRPENVADAPAAYAESDIVRAVSILTNSTHFGGSIHDLANLRLQIAKPALRKDFFIDEYQVREARAFGADAILLMANVLDSHRLAGFHSLACELGMHAVFEVHTEEEIGLLPADAVLVGINSRKFRSQTGFSGAENASATDFSVDLTAFDLAARLPANCTRIAESGLSAANIGQVIGPFHAALVGTSLLRDPRGIRAHLDEFANALQPAPSQ